MKTWRWKGPGSYRIGISHRLMIRSANMYDEGYDGTKSAFLWISGLNGPWMSSVVWEADSAVQANIGQFGIARGRFAVLAEALLSSVFGSSKAIRVNIFIICNLVFLRGLVLSHESLSGSVRQKEKRYSGKWEEVCGSWYYLLDMTRKSYL